MRTHYELLIGFIFDVARGQAESSPGRGVFSPDYSPLFGTVSAFAFWVLSK